MMQKQKPTDSSLAPTAESLKVFFHACVWVFLILCMSLHATPVSAEKIYKWKDENGRTHFTDDILNVPEKHRKQITESDYKPAPAQSPTAENIKEKQVPPDKNEPEKGQIFIPFTSTEGMSSRIIVDVRFNNRVTAKMLVDTGSPGVIISEKLAGQLNLFDSDRSNLMVFVSGIGGKQAAFRTIIDKISIGGITEEYIPAHIVAPMSSSYDGLIGMNMLSNYNVTIDSTAERLIVTPNPAAKNLPAGRNKLWWQRTFREFGFHKKFWKTQAELVKHRKGPYGGMSDSRRERYAEAINYQATVAADLYDRWTQIAIWKIVPMAWRK